MASIRSWYWWLRYGGLTTNSDSLTAPSSFFCILHWASFSAGSFACCGVGVARTSQHLARWTEQVRTRERQPAVCVCGSCGASLFFDLLHARAAPGDVFFLVIAAWRRHFLFSAWLWQPACASAWRRSPPFFLLAQWQPCGVVICPGG
jgi:hypothetical protein